MPQTHVSGTRISSLSPSTLDGSSSMPPLIRITNPRPPIPHTSVVRIPLAGLGVARPGRPPQPALIDMPADEAPVATFGEYGGPDALGRADVGSAPGGQRLALSVKSDKPPQQGLGLGRHGGHARLPRLSAHNRIRGDVRQGGLWRRRPAVLSVPHFRLVKATEPAAEGGK
jgi:hypothetical protein